jgi:hypothetical protein
LWTYGLIPVFFIGVISLGIMFKKRDFLALIPALLTLPVFFYFIQPNISGDHPWMLRRYIFSLYPALLFSAIVGIYTLQIYLSKRYSQYAFFRKQWYAGILLSILFVAQIPFALRVGGFSENAGLLEQTRMLSEKFTPNDLVLIDRLATGTAWSMIPEPLTTLHDIPSAYFFNMKDFDKLDTSGFTNVYLIAPAENAAQYKEQYAENQAKKTQKQLIPIDTFQFSTHILMQASSDTLPIPTPLTQSVSILQLK